MVGWFTGWEQFARLTATVYRGFSTVRHCVRPDIGPRVVSWLPAPKPWTRSSVSLHASSSPWKLWKEKGISSLKQNKYRQDLKKKEKKATSFPWLTDEISEFKWKLVFLSHHLMSILIGDEALTLTRRKFQGFCYQTLTIINAPSSPLTKRERKILLDGSCFGTLHIPYWSGHKNLWRHFSRPLDNQKKRMVKGKKKCLWRLRGRRAPVSTPGAPHEHDRTRLAQF